MVVEARDLSFRFAGSDRPAFQGVTFDAREGSLTVLAGPNGSGKSTLLRCLAGLMPHFYPGELGGALRIEGKDAVALEPSAFFGVVALAGQNPSDQLFASSLREEIAFGLENLGLPSPEIERRIEEVAGRLDLSGDLDRPARSLSGGRQKIALLAVMLALAPKCLLLDEPFANLSPGYQDLLAGHLADLKTLGTAVIVGDHRLRPVWRLADQAVVLESGGAELLPALDRGAAHPFLAACLADGKEGPLPPLRPALGVTRLWSAEGIAYAASGREILVRESLAVSEGETVFVEGANGAGKTTLLRLLRGFLKPRSGELLFKGRRLPRRALSGLSRAIGFAVQNPGLQFCRLTVRAELDLAARLWGAVDPAWSAWVMELLDLRPLEGRIPHQLSEGEKRRLAIGCALVARPEALLLDEPTAGLDPFLRGSLEALLRRLQEGGIALVVATHDERLRSRIPGRSVRIADGRLSE